MKLAVSNIAWDSRYNDEMYDYISSLGYAGLEIAPTKIIAQAPYDHVDSAKKFAKQIQSRSNLCIPSMQSIWFGMNQLIAGSKEDRDILLSYTQKAILFAEAIGCRNLVFGCPKNRNTEHESDADIIIDFLKNSGDFARAHDTVLALEANPVIYNTNFMNFTKDAFYIARSLNSEGIMVNLDVGTIICNNEDIGIVRENINLISHIHISEPFLEAIEKRELHKQLADILRKYGYNHYVSVEMREQKAIEKVKDILIYVKEVFG